MADNPYIHHRKSIRLEGYDYSQAGLYFATICSHDRMHLFGNVVNKKMILNEIGTIEMNVGRKFQNIFRMRFCMNILLCPIMFMG